LSTFPWANVWSLKRRPISSLVLFRARAFMALRDPALLDIFLPFAQCAQGAGALDLLRHDVLKKTSFAVSRSADLGITVFVFQKRPAIKTKTAGPVFLGPYPEVEGRCIDSYESGVWRRWVAGGMACSVQSRAFLSKQK
jgi:hypothetical protein